MAHLAPNVNPLQAGGVYRIDDRIKTAKEWQPDAVLEYQSGRHLGTLTLAGWSDAASAIEAPGSPAARLPGSPDNPWRSSPGSRGPLLHFAMAIEVHVQDSEE